MSLEPIDYKVYKDVQNVNSLTAGNSFINDEIVYFQVLNGNFFAKNLTEFSVELMDFPYVLEYNPVNGQIVANSAISGNISNLQDEIDVLDQAVTVLTQEVDEIKNQIGEIELEQIEDTLNKSNIITWNSTSSEVQAGDGSNGDSFGNSVSIWQTVALIGASLDDTGSVYAFNTIDNGLSWTQRAKIVPSDGTSGDAFGQSVSLFGNLGAIGSYLNNSSGAVYIFGYINDGVTWTQQAKIVGLDTTTDDDFGWSVSLYDTRVLVGARLAGGSNSGAAYIFDSSDSGATWTQTQKIIASDAGTNDEFGYSVGLYVNIAVVGARVESAAYVFRTLNGTSWVQTQKISGSDTISTDNFGFSVAIQADFLCVGAYKQNSDQGAAYVFQTGDGGSSWTESQKLVASDGSASDEFGYSISTDGAFIVVGARVKQNAYVFKTVDTGASWNQLSILNSVETASGDDYGWAVSVNNNYLCVGAPNHVIATPLGASYFFYTDAIDVAAIQTQVTTNTANIATNTAAIAALQPSGIPVYYRKVYVAERNSSNSGKLALGNGSTTATMGALVTEDCELIAIGVSLAGNLTDSTSFYISVNNVNVGGTTINMSSGQQVAFLELDPPVAVVANDYLNAVRSSSTGDWNSTVTFECRVQIDVTTLIGPAGPTGATGAAGASSILFGDGAPSNPSPADSVYFDQLTGEVYKDDGASSWTLAFDSTGPTGAPGASSILFGNGAPSNPSPADSVYYDQLTGDVYKDDGASSWTIAFNQPIPLTTSFSNTFINNVNNASGINFSGFDTTRILDDLGSLITVTSSSITINAGGDGRYQLYGRVFMQSTAARVSVGYAWEINGTTNNRYAESSYIRADSGDNNSSSSPEDEFDLVEDDVITLNCIDLGNSGTVNIPAGQSIFYIRRLKT